MLRSLYQLVELGYRGLGGIVYKATLSGKGGGVKAYDPRGWDRWIFPEKASYLNEPDRHIAK